MQKVFTKMEDLKTIHNDVEFDLARAVSMDEMLNMVKEHIHELYQKQNYENKSESLAGSMELLQQYN